jgi:hypothetical protein
VQPEVAAATAALGGEESALHEPREVPARRRGRHAGLGGEGARRQRAAIAERREHARPSRLGEEHPDRREIRLSVHHRRLANDPFGPDRSEGEELEPCGDPAEDDDAAGLSAPRPHQGVPTAPRGTAHG